MIVDFEKYFKFTPSSDKVLLSLCKDFPLFAEERFVTCDNTLTFQREDELCGAWCRSVSLTDLPTTGSLVTLSQEEQLTVWVVSGQAGRGSALHTSHFLCQLADDI